MTLSSWNSTLPTDLLLDSGVLYIGNSILSAQDGGLVWNPNVARRNVPFDGKRSDIVGLDRTVDYAAAELTGTLMQVPSTQLATFEPGATLVTVSGGPSGATQMSPKPAGTLYAAGDYISNVRAVWERGGGGYFQVRMPKAYVEKWQITGRDKEEVKFAVTIKPRLDMSVTGNTTATPPYVYEYFTPAP